MPLLRGHSGRKVKHDAGLWEEFLPGGLRGSTRTLNTTCMPCGFCRRPILGRYVKTEQGSYHPECYRRHSVPRCAVCGQTVGERYSLDAWGVPFCRDHALTQTLCCFCGRAMALGERDNAGNALTRDRRCRVCRSMGIDRDSQVPGLFHKVVHWMRGEGLALTSTAFPVRLVADTELKTVLGGVVKEAWGIMKSSRSRCGDAWHCQVSEVLLQRGMPEPLAGGVLAHELTHAWLCQHGVSELSRTEAEGVCEWVSHRYLSQFSSPASLYHRQRIEAQTDPIYGAGFRQVTALAKRSGAVGLRAALLQQKRLPR